jgi:hypothetical protein
MYTSTVDVDVYIYTVFFAAHRALVTSDNQPETSWLFGLRGQQSSSPKKQNHDLVYTNEPLTYFLHTHSVAKSSSGEHT